MKVKPKEVMVNLPVALLFDEPWEIISFAANINTILHGKVKLKVEELGTLGGRHVGIFYLDRNGEYHQIRDEFVRLIEQEEIVNHSPPALSEEDRIAEQYDENFGDNKLCLCGHPYYRHFDTYDHMSAIGCKYCYKYTDRHVLDKECPYFKEQKDSTADKHPREEDKYAHGLCPDCDEYSMLHQKGEDHCRCGSEINNGVCEVLRKQYA
jgi:hypothetical protein